MGWERVQVAWVIWFLPVVVALLYLTAGGEPLTLWFGANLLVWPFILFGSLLVHELGHVAAGLLAGLEARRVVLGSGRELLRLELGGLVFQLGSILMFGMTYLSPRAPRDSRLRLWLGIAGGPLATWALVRATMAWRGDEPFVLPLTSAWAGLEMVIAYNTALLAINLIPFRLSSGFETDGRLLLLVPLLGPEHFRDYPLSGRLLDVGEALEANDLERASSLLSALLAEHPASRAARVSLSVLELERGNVAEARSILTELLQNPVSEREGLMLENSLAWANFIARDSELLPQADELSARVAKRLPGMAFACGTRGAVLLWKGEIEEACQLLHTAFMRSASRSGRAADACCLALAWARRGEWKQSQDWLAVAEREDPKCTLLPEARAAVQVAHGAP